MESLKISAFDGQASTFAVLPDGRIVVDNASDDLQDVHNLFSLLAESKSMTGEAMDVLRRDFLDGNSGSAVFDVGGRSFYLVYESANFQNWTILGIAPTDVVNASMNKLQYTTMLVVSGISIALALVILLMVVQQNRQKLKRKDKQLLARDELFSKLSINVDDVFLMVDAEDLRVEYVSPNVEKLVGIPQQQVLNDIHVIEQLIRPDEREHILDHLSSILPGQQRAWDREYTHQITGEELWFRVVVFCSDIQGEQKYILDLSDRTKDKRINQELEDAVHAAQSANRAKTTFLNNMSHDIRTPMNAIIGFTNIAMKLEPKPEVRNCLERISESSEHLLTLINDVLDISRIESGKVHYTPAPVDIAGLTDSVITIMHGYLSNRDITFRTELEYPEERFVMTDAVRLREVIVNILGNAVKFTEDGGTVTLSVSWRAGKDDGSVTVIYRISDTGIGMSEDFVEHIFEEFSQEDHGARTQYKGTGLGMAITKRYVDLMGGTISVESRKGVGSVFTVELPMERADSPELKKSNSGLCKADLKGTNVLLAEDNDLNAEISIVQLEELGMEIERAIDGEDAVRIFRDNPEGTFDIILMDVMMPKMNGYEATKAIRGMKDRPDAAVIPIIAMTANAFAEDVQASMDAGMNSHLSKPIDVTALMSTIQMCLYRANS